MGASLTNRTERLSRIEQLLARSVHGLRAVEIAEACGVDRRTIYRDISLLHRTGLPIAQTYGRFYLDRTQYVAHIRLNLHETLSLILAASVLVRQSNQHNAVLMSALHTLSQSLPDEMKRMTDELLSPAIRRDTDPLETILMETIFRAWAERRWLRLRYQSRSGKVRYIHLAVYLVDAKPNGKLYVIGKERVSERVLSIKLERIMHVRMLNEIYVRPVNFDARIYLWNYRASPTDSADTL